MGLLSNTGVGVFRPEMIEKLGYKKYESQSGLRFVSQKNSRHYFIWDERGPHIDLNYKQSFTHVKIRGVEDLHLIEKMWEAPEKQRIKIARKLCTRN